MKNLKKIRLKELGQVLEDQEMKLVVGGGMEVYSCKRLDPDGKWIFFNTDNEALSTSWSNFWTGAGQKVECWEYGRGYIPYG